MNIWLIVLIIITFALILGPMSMLRPRPEQKRKEKLRWLASEKRIRFGMRKLPKLATDMDEPSVRAVYYLPPIPEHQGEKDWLLIKTAYEHEGNFHNEWNWQTPERPTLHVESVLLEWLEKLPAGVSAISQGDTGTCVYWNEQGEEGDLLELITMLKALKQAAEQDYL
jgi:hypothetical protein